MTYSTQAGKLWIEFVTKKLIKKCPNSILDIGAGSGAYSDLLKAKLPGTTFTALEVWEPYIAKYHLEKKYDTILQLDVRNFSPETTYGITILGNVLEYLSQEEAVEVYNNLLKSSHFVIISIPINKCSQATPKDNPYEKIQKDDWSHEGVLATFEHIVLHHLDNEIGVYLGVNPQHHSFEEVSRLVKPSLAVYGIYKNEEQHMERFLRSVQTADEIVLCDTGSTDQTNQIISQFKETHPHVNLRVYSICVSPWRFDDARNTSLSLVSPDIDLCISLDIDQYLMDGWKEYLIDNWEVGYTKYCHRQRTIIGGENTLDDWSEKIHSRSGYTWKLPVYEILEYNKQEKIKKLPDFWVYHELAPDKERLNILPLLEQSVKEKKDIWQSWSYLAEEYLSSGRYGAALQALETALELKDSDKAYLYKQQYLVYKAQNQVNLALLSLSNVILHLPERREPYFEKALYLHQLGRHLEAYATLKEGKNFTNKILDRHYNPAAWHTEFDQLLTKLRELAQEEVINFD